MGAFLLIHATKGEIIPETGAVKTARAGLRNEFGVILQKIVALVMYIGQLY